MSKVFNRKGNFLSKSVETKILNCFDNDIEKMSEQEYTTNIFKYWAYKSNGNLIPWFDRLNESILTTDDFTINDVNNLLGTTEFIKDVMQDRKFMHIGTIKIGRMHKTSTGMFQPGMIEERFDETEHIWTSPEGVYMLKCTYNGVSYWIKIGKASKSISARMKDYHSKGKYVNNATLTEIHLCELLKAGLTIDIYGITCQITKPVLAGHNVIRPNNVISSDNLEDWLRSELISIYGKKFVE